MRASRLVADRSRRTTVTSPLREVARSDLDANGTPLSSQSTARRPKRDVDAGVELGPHAGGLELGDEPRGRFAGAVLVPHEQHDDLRRRERGAAPAGPRRHRAP